MLVGNNESRRETDNRENDQPNRVHRHNRVKACLHSLERLSHTTNQQHDALVDAPCGSYRQDSRSYRQKPVRVLLKPTHRIHEGGDDLFTEDANNSLPEVDCVIDTSRDRREVNLLDPIGKPAHGIPTEGEDSVTDRFKRDQRLVLEDLPLLREVRSLLTQAQDRVTRRAQRRLQLVHVQLAGLQRPHELRRTTSTKHLRRQISGTSNIASIHKPLNLARNTIESISGPLAILRQRNKRLRQATHHLIGIQARLIQQTNHRRSILKRETKVLQRGRILLHRIR